MTSVTDLSRGKLLLIVLSLLFGLRLIFALAPTSEPNAEDASQPSATTDLATPAETESAAPPTDPLEDFAEMDQRPLFIASRRASDEGSSSLDETSGTFELGGYALQGVVESDTGAWALLRRKGQQETLRLAQGQSVSGWEIMEIGTDYIKLSRDGKGEVLVLKQANTP